MVDRLRHGIDRVAALQCRHQVVEMQCALQAGAPLRQRGLEARVAIAAHNGWQPVVRREHRLQRRAGQPVRDRLAVLR